MPVLSVIFPGIERRGSIIITNPVGKIRFTREQVRPADAPAHPKAVESPLAISCANFPQREIKWLDVVAHTDRDYRWFTALVDGAEQGDFSGSIFIWRANEITPVRFDLYNGEGILVARTGYHDIRAQLVGDPQPPEDVGAVVTFPDDLAARISRVVRIDQASGAEGNIPVFIWLDVTKAPIGTTHLNLTLVTEGINPELDVRVEWLGKGPYGFAGRISRKKYAGVIGQPAGKEIRIGTILRAWQGKSILAALREGWFSLDQVEMS